MDGQWTNIAEYSFTPGGADEFDFLETICKNIYIVWFNKVILTKRCHVQSVR